jgi:hypothetical protein
VLLLPINGNTRANRWLVSKIYTVDHSADPDATLAMRPSHRHRVTCSTSDASIAQPVTQTDVYFRAEIWPYTERLVL